MNPRHGWIDYHERMARLMRHIHDHLAEPLELAALGEVVHLSPFHWHRVYHALYGETIAATVRRIRLHRASGDLANTTLGIAAVAKRCGYPAARSFARAFRAAYGMNPAEYRERGGHTSFRATPDRAAAPAQQVEIREVARVRLAGVEHTGSYMLIGRAFETAYAHASAQGWVSAATRWIAEYRDDPFLIRESQLSSRAGLSLPDGTRAAPPLVGFEVDGGTCAVLRHRGPYATMRAAYQWLYGTWLVESGRTPADRPVFEEYLNNPRETAPADLLTDICLPLA
jgi:AraC family transcriptional regulator